MKTIVALVVVGVGVLIFVHARYRRALDNYKEIDKKHKIVSEEFKRVSVGTVTFEGTVLQVSDDKLTMHEDELNRSHTQSVRPDTTITRDGKSCQLSDLKKSDRVKVTVEKKEGKNVVTKVEAKKTS